MDGYSIHNAQIIQNYLQDILEIISIYGSVRWPAHSSDLSPMEFFMRTLKIFIYQTSKNNI